MGIYQRYLGDISSSLRTFFDTAVAGVCWIQRGGTAACEWMKLRGESFRELSAEDQETLADAALLNQRARELLGEKSSAEALATMEEASALFVKVHGENHHDSGNSFANLGSIHDSLGERVLAEKMWAKALLIHEKTLGSSHPHTALTRFNLGRNLFEQGKTAQAKELWKQYDWSRVYGSEYPLVRQLDSLLPRL